MPVDDIILESLESKVEQELRVNNTKRHTLETMKERIQKIIKVNVPDPTEEFPHKTKKILPLDTDVNTIISTPQRQKIYDVILEQKIELGL